MTARFNQLQDIAKRYESSSGGDANKRRKRFDELFERYFEGRVKPFAEALACGAAVSALSAGQAFDPARLDEQQLEAFRLAFPNLRVEDISDYSGEALGGLLNAWKGKLFEVKVRDSLNDGEWVGDLHLAPGQKAALADSATQPGWDLAILEPDGSTAYLKQLKATDFVDYVESAAERYRDIPIIVTAEAAGASSPHTDISVSVFSDAGLEQELSDATEIALVDSIWGSVLPALPFALNLYLVAKGDRTPAQAVRAVAASAAAIGAGTVATDLVLDGVIDVGLGFLLPFGVGFLARKFFGWLFSGDEEVRRVPEKVIDKDALASRLEQAAQRVEAIGRRYLPPPAPGVA